MAKLRSSNGAAQNADRNVEKKASSRRNSPTKPNSQPLDPATEQFIDDTKPIESSDTANDDNNTGKPNEKSLAGACTTDADAALAATPSTNVVKTPIPGPGDAAPDVDAAESIIDTNTAQTPENVDASLKHRLSTPVIRAPSNTMTPSIAPTVEGADCENELPNKRRRLDVNVEAQAQHDGRSEDAEMLDAPAGDQSDEGSGERPPIRETTPVRDRVAERRLNLQIDRPATLRKHATPEPQGGPSAAMIKIASDYKPLADDYNSLLAHVDKLETECKRLESERNDSSYHAQVQSVRARNAQRESEAAQKVEKLSLKRDETIKALSTQLLSTVALVAKVRYDVSDAMRRYLDDATAPVVNESDVIVKQLQALTTNSIKVPVVTMDMVEEAARLPGGATVPNISSVWRGHQANAGQDGFYYKRSIDATGNLKKVLAGLPHLPIIDVKKEELDSPTRNATSKLRAPTKPRGITKDAAKGRKAAKKNAFYLLDVSNAQVKKSAQLESDLYKSMGFLVPPTSQDLVIGEAAKVCNTEHGTGWIVVLAHDVQQCPECKQTKNFTPLNFSLKSKAKVYQLRPGKGIDEDGFIIDGNGSRLEDDTQFGNNIEHFLGGIGEDVWQKGTVYQKKKPDAYIVKNGRLTLVRAEKKMTSTPVKSRGKAAGRAKGRHKIVVDDNEDDEDDDNEEDEDVNSGTAGRDNGRDDLEKDGSSSEVPLAYYVHPDDLNDQKLVRKQPTNMYKGSREWKGRSSAGWRTVGRKESEDDVVHLAELHTKRFKSSFPAFIKNGFRPHPPQFIFKEILLYIRAHQDEGRLSEFKMTHELLPDDVMDWHGSTDKPAKSPKQLTKLFKDLGEKPPVNGKESKADNVLQYLPPIAPELLNKPFPLDMTYGADGVFATVECNERTLEPLEMTYLENEIVDDDCEGLKVVGHLVIFGTRSIKDNVAVPMNFKKYLAITAQRQFLTAGAYGGKLILRYSLIDFYKFYEELERQTRRNQGKAGTYYDAFNDWDKHRNNYGYVPSEDMMNQALRGENIVCNGYTPMCRGLQDRAVYWDTKTNPELKNGTPYDLIDERSVPLSVKGLPEGYVTLTNYVRHCKAFQLGQARQDAYMIEIFKDDLEQCVDNAITVYLNRRRFGYCQNFELHRHRLDAYDLVECRDAHLAVAKSGWAQPLHAFSRDIEPRAILGNIPCKPLDPRKMTPPTAKQYPLYQKALQSKNALGSTKAVREPYLYGFFEGKKPSYNQYEPYSDKTGFEEPDESHSEVVAKPPKKPHTEAVIKTEQMATSAKTTPDTDAYGYGNEPRSAYNLFSAPDYVSPFTEFYSDDGDIV